MPAQLGPETRRLLADLIRSWRDITLEVRQGGGLGALVPIGALSMAAWYVQNRELIPAPYDRHPLVPMLEALLASDGHLRSCCVDAARLAKALEVIALDQLAQGPMLGDASPAFLDQVTDYLLARLFEDDYSRAVYFRLYNLIVEESPLEIHPINGVVELLTGREIPEITGEPTPTSTLNVPDTGDVFLVFSDTGYGDDMEWWRARWAEALRLLGVLQYIKYAIVDVDYSAPGHLFRMGEMAGWRARLTQQHKREEKMGPYRKFRLSIYVWQFSAECAPRMVCGQGCEL